VRKILISAYMFSALTAFFNITVTAQTPDQSAPNDTCLGVIYKNSEVTLRAVLTSRPRAALTVAARANGVRGRVKLKAVLCQSGRVTDIRVIEDLPFGVTEQAVEAARKINFTPAEIDGQAVAQELNIEYSFSYIGDRRPLAIGKLEGRPITSIEVIGYSESTRSEIKKCMNLLEGRAYNKDLIKQVRQILLKLEDFDPETSKLCIEESDLGGLSVVFLLQRKLKK
jgi:TonB family protein